MSTSRRAFSLRIFLPDGSPDGLKLVEKTNWSGEGVVCPRPLLPQKKARPEFLRTGVYILIGPPAESGLPMIYIGEAEQIRARLEQHASGKDFWTTVIFFTSKDDWLNKADVQYLESQLIHLAAAAKRCVLENGNAPDRCSLSEADRATADGFLDEMLLCLPVLGLTVFERPAAVSEQQQILYLKAKDCEGRGYESSDGFVVLAGSRARVGETASIHPYMRALRQTLLDGGIFELQANGYVVTQDYVFNSPSTAAGVMAGRNANGRREWKDKSGKELKVIQAEQLALDDAD